jgi:phosphatidate cytidylyltransferase
VLRDRVVTAVVLLGILLAALFFLPALGWTALCAFVLAVAAWEWAGFIRARNSWRFAYAASTLGLGLGAAHAAGIPTGGAGAPEPLTALYGAALAFWVIAVPIWLRLRPTRPADALILLFGWLALIPAFLALVQLRNMHPAMLLLFMATVWVADIAAYFFGRRFGRHKLAPSVSPGKTWEGFAGALAATAVYALVWIALLRPYAPAVVRDLPASVGGMLILIETLAVLSVLGDLFESSMKRQAGLKDSGTILPGHGGVLDRIDALMPVLPAAALVSMI